MNDDFIKKARNYQKEIYQPYGKYLYVPMAEAASLMLPVTIGCSYDACLYCDLNQTNKFQVYSLFQIEENLKKLHYIRSKNKRQVKRIVLLAANPLVLDTDYLIEISILCKKYFKCLDYISLFARVDDVLNKSKDELRALKYHGYNRFSLGIESGSDQVLKLQNKGVTSQDNLRAMTKLEDLDISYSVYIMLGLGGVKYSLDHSQKTAQLLSKVNPFEINLVTLVLFKNAPLLKLVRKGDFKRLSPIEALREEYDLIQGLHMTNTLFNASHKTNTIGLKAYLPQHKEILLEKLAGEIKRLEDRDLGLYEHKRWNKWSIE